MGQICRVSVWEQIYIHTYTYTHARTPHTRTFMPSSRYFFHLGHTRASDRVCGAVTRGLWGYIWGNMGVYGVRMRREGGQQLQTTTRQKRTTEHRQLPPTCPLSNPDDPNPNPSPNPNPHLGVGADLPPYEKTVCRKRLCGNHRDQVHLQRGGVGVSGRVRVRVRVSGGHVQG